MASLTGLELVTVRCGRKTNVSYCISTHYCLLLKSFWDMIWFVSPCLICLGAALLHLGSRWDSCDPFCVWYKFSPWRPLPWTMWEASAHTGTLEQSRYSCSAHTQQRQLFPLISSSLSCLGAANKSNPMLQQMAGNFTQVILSDAGDHWGLQ